jgi:hypothetical protein
MADFEKLTLSPEVADQMMAAAGPKRKSKQLRGAVPFIKFPRIWWEELAKARAGGSAYRVAIYLLNEAFRSKAFRSAPPVVKVSNSAMREWAVGREGKAAALRVLRKAGLVRVEERPKKSPLVTVLFVD